MLQRGFIAGAAALDDGSGLLVILVDGKAVDLPLPGRIVTAVCGGLGHDKVVGWPCTWDGLTLDLKGAADAVHGDPRDTPKSAAGIVE